MLKCEVSYIYYHEHSHLSDVYWHEDNNLSENDVALGRLPAPRKLLLFARFDVCPICYLHVRYAIFTNFKNRYVLMIYNMFKCVVYTLM